MTVREYTNENKNGMVLIDFKSNGEPTFKRYPPNLLYKISNKYLDLEIMDIRENEDDLTEIYIMERLR